MYRFDRFCGHPRGKMILVKYSSQILCEYEGFRLARKYVYGPGIDEPVRMTILPNTDLNGDSSTDLQDIYVMSASWMRHSGDPAYNHTADLNSDGVVDNLDADILAGNWRAVNAAGRHYYYHFDGLGSVIALTDSSGKTVEIYRYSAFGQTTIYNAQNHPIAASQVGNIYYITGRQLDTETGLYYYRARMYSPALGRFMQTDPIGYADGMGWYAYCSNNPISQIDPLGLSAWARFTGGLKVFGGAIEALSGGTFAFVTSETVVGAIAGAAVAAHGIDTIQAGARQLWTGDETDSITSKGIQAMGVSRETANLADAGIGLVGSLGTGMMNSAGAMEIAVGKGMKPFGVHFAYATEEGQWLHAAANNAANPRLGDMTVVAESSIGRLLQSGRWGWSQTSLPVFNEGAVAATEGTAAWSCFGAATRAAWNSGALPYAFGTGIQSARTGWLLGGAISGCPSKN